MENKCGLSICILSYNNIKILDKCIQSIYENCEGTNIEILVFDNGSTDNTENVISINYPNVIVYRNHENISFSRAFNILYSHTKHSIVGIFNNDILIKDPATFKTVIREFSTNNRLGAINFKSVKPSGEIDIVNKRKIQLIPLLSRMIIGVNKIKNHKTLSRMQLSRADNAEILQDSSIFIHKRAIGELNPYDESLKFYFTEDQLADLIQRNKYCLCYDPSISLIHHHSLTMDGICKKSKRRLYLQDLMVYLLNYRLNFYNWPVVIIICLIISLKVRYKKNG